MSTSSIIITIAAYFVVMLGISWLAGRKNDNAGFFSGGRKQPWYIVAIAMIGSAMSGVTFVSVPGMVSISGFGYMQMALGFIAGQLVIAFVLIPLFYRMDLVSIYGYLEDRFGISAYRTGAWFFFISKMLGASVRLYLVCSSWYVFTPLGIPFWANVIITICILLLYTIRGGVKSVIWTDVLKTACMTASIILCTVFICKSLGLSFGSMCKEVADSGMSRIFFFDDPKHPQYFFKQFFGGMFTLIAMTGLDQDMMQRSLSCKNFRDSQKNIVTSSLMQTAVIFLFLALGVLLYMFAGSVQDSTLSDASGDRIFPAVATCGLLPPIVGIAFIIGLVSCSYASGGSALTAVTTSFTIDIVGIRNKSEKAAAATRRTVHVGMAICMGLTIIVFDFLNSTSAIDAVYKIAGYTYGPILGMFAFGILSKRRPADKAVPFIAIAAPIICLILQLNSERWFGGYKFSYELLILNAMLTCAGLFAFSRKCD